MGWSFEDIDPIASLASGNGLPDPLGIMGGSGSRDSGAGALSELDKIPDILKQYYNPYVNQGTDSMGMLNPQYKQMINDPGGLVNKIGTGYQKSPGYDFNVQEALKASNRAAAAGGMAGSPMNQRENMELASHLADQDYNGWLSHALGQYNQGISGENALTNLGYNSSNELAQSIANSMLSKAKLQYQSTADKNNADAQDSANSQQEMMQLAGMAAMMFL